MLEGSTKAICCVEIRVGKSVQNVVKISENWKKCVNSGLMIPVTKVN